MEENLIKTIQTGKQEEEIEYSIRNSAKQEQLSYTI